MNHVAEGVKFDPLSLPVWKPHQSDNVKNQPLFPYSLDYLISKTEKIIMDDLCVCIGEEDDHQEVRRLRQKHDVHQGGKR